MYQIVIVKRGDDCGRVIQYANTFTQATRLIESILPPTSPGYYYQIVTNN
jgi:hypothetical protein